MSSRLHADDYRRLLLVLEACGRAVSLPEFLDTTLRALDEHLGVGTAAFMLALGHPAVPGERAYGGAQYGAPEYVFEEYFERWADCDPLASLPSRQRYRSHSVTSIEDVYRELEPARRRFVDDFLRRVREQYQLSVWLDPGTTTHGYLTLMGPDEYSDLDHARLLALQPHLTNLLRLHLPKGERVSKPRVLTYREAEVAELVALGWSNREIAAVLHVEEDTVKKHVSHALAKLSLKRRTQLAATWTDGLPKPTPSPASPAPRPAPARPTR